MTFNVRCYYICYDGLFDCNICERERKHDRAFETPGEAAEYILRPPYADEGFYTFTVGEE